jgi:hypothetical protein
MTMQPVWAVDHSENDNRIAHKLIGLKQLVQVADWSENLNLVLKNGWGWKRGL